MRRVDRDRLAHPRKNPSGITRQSNGRRTVPERIDVYQWIHREATLKFGGWIAAPIGDPAMGVFVQYHGKEERERHVGYRVENLR
jgi:hypothetical protein